MGRSDLVFKGFHSAGSAYIRQRDLAERYHRALCAILTKRVRTIHDSHYDVYLTTQDEEEGLVIMVFRSQCAEKPVMKIKNESEIKSWLQTLGETPDSENCRLREMLYEILHLIADQRRTKAVSE